MKIVPLKEKYKGTQLALWLLFRLSWQGGDGLTFNQHTFWIWRATNMFTLLLGLRCWGGIGAIHKT